MTKGTSSFLAAIWQTSEASDSKTDGGC